MKFDLRCIVSMMLALVLTACEDGENFAPVTDVAGIEPIPRAGVHRVKHGETLYEIAWRYGMDYRELAARNHMRSPFVLHTGQTIALRTYAASSVVYHHDIYNKINQPNLTRMVKSGPAIESPIFVPTAMEVAEPQVTDRAWIWPAKGKVISSFSGLNKGTNIAGYRGEPIYAAAAGKVVYSGSGLRGYGNLIIIKHNMIYLSAYAHNSKVLVNNGDWVKKGQKIAEMGNTGTDKTMLHFEIRRAGKPIDPVNFYSTGG